MAAPRTRIDLVNEALKNLGVLAAGQTANAEDFEAVNDKVDELMSYLAHVDIIDIDNIDEIQPEIFSSLAVLLADDCALQFGLPGIPVSPSNPDPVQAAEDSIRLVTYGRPTYERLKTEDF